MPARPTRKRAGAPPLPPKPTGAGRKRSAPPRRRAAGPRRRRAARPRKRRRAARPRRRRRAARPRRRRRAARPRKRRGVRKRNRGARWPSGPARRRPPRLRRWPPPARSPRWPKKRKKRRKRKKSGRRGARVEVKKPMAPLRREEMRRRTGKLTVTRALDEEDERVRSLASVRRARERERQRLQQSQQEQVKVVRDVVIPETITVQELANRMAERGADVIKALMRMGVMATINQLIDADTA